MGHVITGPVITGPVGTGSIRIRQKKQQRSVLKEAFKNAWKQGNISTQVSSCMLHVCVCMSVCVCLCMCVYAHICACVCVFVKCVIDVIIYRLGVMMKNSGQHFQQNLLQCL